MEASRGIEVGTPLLGARGRRIGTWMPSLPTIFSFARPAAPVDLYVPRTETALEDGRLRAGIGRREAYERRWHRPLKRAPHATE